MPKDQERPDLRDAMDQARAEHAKQERIRLAGSLLEACAGYVSPNMAICISPGESLALLDERAGVAETLEANEEFCEAWVQKHWIPSIEAVLAVLDPAVVEGFEPSVDKTKLGADARRISFREVHLLYCRLMRDQTTAESVIQELAGLRRELGRNRYLIQDVFKQLAGHVKRALKPPRDAAIPAQHAKTENGPGQSQSADLVRLSAPEIARLFGLPEDRLRKALERYRRSHMDEGWVEVSDRRRKEPKYLYDLEAVRPVAEGVHKRMQARQSGFKRPPQG